MKFMIASITVSERTRASRAPFIDALTASTICAFVAAAMKRGMLAAEDAAFCAARQPARRSPLALAADFCAASEESWRRNAMKTRERMGYASHVRERRCESCRYGVRPELDTGSVESYPGGGD